MKGNSVSNKLKIAGIAMAIGLAAGGLQSCKKERHVQAQAVDYQRNSMVEEMCQGINRDPELRTSRNLALRQFKWANADSYEDEEEIVRGKCIAYDIDHCYATIKCTFSKKYKESGIRSEYYIIFESYFDPIDIEWSAGNIIDEG
ncbi:TPA: hypothetical protein HA265_03720 [Candidatus Woesearchaeota archaeon]|nr:hypothetical protein [Candidatus Woesearchaeota archaeon]